MPLANSFLAQHAEHYRKQIAGFDETLENDCYSIGFQEMFESSIISSNAPC